MWYCAGIREVEFVFLNMTLVDEIIVAALKEDIGTGDVTTLSTIPPEAVTRAFIYAKANGVVAGLSVVERVFQILSIQIKVESKCQDGDRVVKGDVLATISGPACQILMGERTALNLLQRLSGIATRTAHIVELVAPYNTSVTDTRKTTPGLRLLEKYAVWVAGGKNHRFGLYDGVLIKDNHIKVAGGIKKAVAMVRSNVPDTLKIEVEVENLEEVKEALGANADIIMLDNMGVDTIKEAVKIIAGQALVEVSGGITEDNVVEYAKAGVDRISIGALTHSVKALDISLDVGEIKLS
jgi:nicotinate-nucleotide pyrophosphorylase (carboxylating)